MREYSMELADQIKKYLEEEEVRYNFHEEDGVFITTFGGMEASGMGTCEVMVRVWTEMISVLTILPIRCIAPARVRAAEYLTRANYGLRVGNFEMDFTDGEIRYKVTIPCDPSSLVIPSMRGFWTGPSMQERYGTGLLKVIFGGMSPEEAINEAESDDTEEKFRRSLDNPSSIEPSELDDE